MGKICACAAGPPWHSSALAVCCGEGHKSSPQPEHRSKYVSRHRPGHCQESVSAILPRVPSKPLNLVFVIPAAAILHLPFVNHVGAFLNHMLIGAHLTMGFTLRNYAHRTGTSWCTVHLAFMGKASSPRHAQWLHLTLEAMDAVKSCAVRTHQPTNCTKTSGTHKPNKLNPYWPTTGCVGDGCRNGLTCYAT